MNTAFKEINMSNEQQKVTAFFASADELLKSATTMQDIFLAATSKKYKNNKALTYINDKGKKTSIKYKKYRGLVFEYASRLNSSFINAPQNSIIALKVKNTPEWPLLFWGLLMTGKRVLLIDAKLAKENTLHLLQEANAVGIVTSDINDYEGYKTVNYLSLKNEKADYKFAGSWANEIIFCSSGTTGNVKLMVFNGKNMCHQIASALSMPEVTLDIMYPGEINILAFIPFHHIFGFVAVFLWYTFFGKNIVFIKDNSPKEIMLTCQKCDVTHVYAVPLFWDNIAQNIMRKASLEGEKKVEIVSKMIAYNTHKIDKEEAGVSSSGIALKTLQDKLLGHKIRFLISGGGFISNETLNTINGIGYPLYNGYGMTEAGVTSVELSSKVEYRLKGSIGRPLFGVTYALKNTNKLHEDTGELLIKSEITHVREIVHGQEVTPNLVDGFLETGDIASVDEKGFYYIKGRIKDVIINENGENIYPDEIESYFKEIPHISSVCVVGIKKGRTNHETITCIFELKNDVDDDTLLKIKEEAKKINDTLTNEKKVEEFLISKDKLPLTASFKVKRFAVKELLKNNKASFLTFNEKKEVKSFEGYSLSEIEPVNKMVRKLFEKTLLLPSIKINDDDHWINDLGGDSMSYIELVNALNEEFKITIPMDKYGVLVCVNDFVKEILDLKKANKDC